MSTNHQEQSRQQGNERQEQPLQPPRRHVNASPDDRDEDMEQGTQSGNASPRSAESAAPNVMKKDRDTEDDRTS